MASAAVLNGDITLTLASDLGTGLAGQTITMRMDKGSSSLTWFNSTTVTNEAAKQAILRNNIATAVAAL